MKPLGLNAAESRLALSFSRDAVCHKDHFFFIKHEIQEILLNRACWIRVMPKYLSKMTRAH